MVVVVVAHPRRRERRRSARVSRRRRPAGPPFAEFGEAHVAVGRACLRVLVASTPSQRTQGLREVHVACARTTGCCSSLRATRTRGSRWPTRRCRSTSRSSPRRGAGRPGSDDAVPARHRRDLSRVREQDGVPLRARTAGRAAAAGSGALGACGVAAEQRSRSTVSPLL